jgi:hypothetical protein
MGGMQTGPAAFGAAVGQYMSPYQQNVTDIQKREATRLSDIQGQTDQARAAQAGGFGGYRDALVRSERERNLGQNLDDIQARGSQSAFDRAASQYNTGVGQTQDVARLQNAMGTQQQANVQQNLNQQYQDFLTQKQQPYKDLGFMKDILSGSGTSSINQQYGQAPNNTAQTAGLITAGLGALGKKDGGTIRGYADGGVIGAPNDLELQAMLTKMSDAQLQQLAKSGKYDPQTIRQEMQRRAQIRAGGLAALPSAQEEYADGGIIGFDGSSGSSVPPEEDGPAESTIGKWWRGQLAAQEQRVADRQVDQERLREGTEAARQRRLAWVAPWEAVTPAERARREAIYKGAGAPADAPYVDESARGSRKDTRASAPTPVAAAVPTPVAAQSATPVATTPSAPAARRTAASTVAAGTKPSARTGATPGLPGILSAKEATATTTSAKASPVDFQVEDYESMVRRRNELAKEGNAEIDSAYKQYQDQNRAERAEIKAREKGHFWDALMHGGLAMAAAGGQGESILTAATKGLGAGLGSIQQAKKLDQAALKANQQADDTLKQAKRMERLGNLKETTALYAQHRAEKATAAQLAMQAAKAAQDYDFNLKQLAIRQQEANQQGQHYRNMAAAGGAGGRGGAGGLKMDETAMREMTKIQNAASAQLQKSDPMFGMKPLAEQQQQLDAAVYAAAIRNPLLRKYYTDSTMAAASPSGAKYDFNDLIK